METAMPGFLKVWIGQLDKEKIKELYMWLDGAPSALDDMIDSVSVRGNELYPEGLEEKEQE